MKRLLHVAAALAVAAAFLAYALWDVDLRALGALLADADLRLLVPFQVALVAFFALKAVRWAYLLAPVAALGARDVAGAMLIGFAGNNLLPARVGEILRVLALARARSCSMAAVGASVALERLLDTVAILALFLLVLPRLGALDPDLGRAIAGVAIVVGAALAVVLATVWAPARVLSAWDALAGWLPERLRAGGRDAIVNVTRALETARSPLRLAVALVNSLLQWMLAAFLVWLSMRAVGAPVDAHVCVVVLTTTAVAAAAPSAPGFVGAIQAAFVFALTPFGVSREAAVAASVAYLVAQWIPVTCAGLVCFARHVRRFESLRAAFLRLD